MRVRAIYFRDYGGTTLNGSATNVYVYVNGTYTLKKLKASDADYWTYVGDTPPIKESGLLSLCHHSARTSKVTSIRKRRGAAATCRKSGLECVNSAMSSSWAKIGDIPAGGSKPINSIYPLIVVWTDAAAHKPSYSLSLKNPTYPATAVMPRNYTDLLAKWNNAAVIDQSKKMLVFFGNPSMSPTTMTGSPMAAAKVKSVAGLHAGRHPDRRQHEHGQQASPMRSPARCVRPR